MKVIMRRYVLPGGKVMDVAVGTMRYVPPAEPWTFDADRMSYTLNLGHHVYEPPADAAPEELAVASG